MMIGRAEIGTLIPHAGAMCLIDSVLDWTETHIRCSATSHTRTNHPLAREDVVPVLAGLEYAAQAMAIHGRLSGIAEEAPRAGFIASVRELVWSARRLDDSPAPLLIDAEKLAGDGMTALYAFRLTAAERELLRGRAAVLLAQEAA